jgi:hypothetical protein
LGDYSVQIQVSPLLSPTTILIQGVVWGVENNEQFAMLYIIVPFLQFPLYGVFQTVKCDLLVFHEDS